MVSNFELPARFELQFRRAIFNTIRREIPPNLSASNLSDWLNQLESISDDPHFNKLARDLALKLIRDIEIHNVLEWRNLGRQATEGTRVYRKLQYRVGHTLEDQIDLTANYINSIPRKVAVKLRGEVSQLKASDNTEQGIYNVISSRFPALMAARIKLLAKTDPHRINSKLTEIRSDQLNINCFIWINLDDSLVRSSHKKLNGVVVFWRDLPDPEILIGLRSTFGKYAPGGCSNCRCSAVPVISVKDLFRDKGRVEVYYNGRINKLTLIQLIKIIGSS